MKDKKFEDFWLEKSKEEIINAYRECIHNGEVLLSRIDKAIEYIRQYDGHISGYYYSKEAKRFLVEENVKNDLLDILKGREKE